ncbi:hypothetical protein ACLQ25_32545, partial [Micromonospora sp. DT44]|uniref:hypothetical protein n=1 Tax=Micromonospora sp. DT44 TaxID=3393439 RepID=UPI003CF45198
PSGMDVTPVSSPLGRRILLRSPQWTVYEIDLGVELKPRSARCYAIVGVGKQRRDVMGTPERKAGWSEAQMSLYDQARETIRSVVAAYSARLAAADPAEYEALRAEQHRHARLLRTLRPEDTSTIALVLAEYPTLLASIDGR